MKKKIIAIAAGTIMTIGMTTTAFAVTPQYHSWVPKIPSITWDSMSDESKEIINDAVSDIIEDIDFEINVLSSPTISEATYHHGRFFYDKTRLQIRWEKVTNVDYYEVRVTKADGTSNVYITSDTSLFIYEKTDDFITGCIRSGKVEVRDCKGDIKSTWSKAKTISCNSFH